jgi:leader peptidase (prepilin peptidase) / N-methyltransferase
VTAIVVTFAGVVGLCIGSFLNVVAYRLPRHDSLTHPPSRCPECGTPIRWHDNIPVVSWVALRGRCRACATSISARYPLIELATGLVFVAVALALV